MSDVLIEARALTRQFDVSSPWLNRLLQRESKRILTAVDDVSFQIERGKTYALVGESGSGKSTIAAMLVGLLRPSSGDVIIDGINITDKTANQQSTTANTGDSLRGRVQMIFQDPYASLNPRWRVRDIIAEPLLVLKNTSASARQQRVDELLEQVGLNQNDGHKFPHEFSGGQRQRICIARALASRPEFIVCDEPTSALDVSVQAQVLNLMRDLQSELNLTYLFITHDLSVVRYMADDIGVLYLGRIVESATREELFSHPSHPYTQMLLDAAPTLDGFDRDHDTNSGEIPDPINRPDGCHFHPRCPGARDKCTTTLPETGNRPGNTGTVACWYPGNVALDAKTP